MPHVGDKVVPERSESIWVITRVSPSGDEVDLNFEGTSLERFQVKSAYLKYIDRVKRSGKPAVEAIPKLDAGEVLDRIGTLQRESLKRLEDDIDILTKYLKTKEVPQGAIDAFEVLQRKQQESWNLTIAQIAELLEH